MAQSWELAQIDERRQKLIAEGDRLRRQIDTELACLETAAYWVEKGFSLVQSLRSWWPVAAAGLGLFLGRKGGRSLKRLGKLWSLWRVFRQAMSLWRQYFSRPPAHETGS